MDPHITSNINEVQKSIEEFINEAGLLYSHPLYREYQSKMGLCSNLVVAFLIIFSIHVGLKFTFGLKKSYIDITTIYVIATLVINCFNLFYLYKQKKLVKRLKGEIK